MADTPTRNRRRTAPPVPPVHGTTDAPSAETRKANILSLTGTYLGKPFSVKGLHTETSADDNGNRWVRTLVPLSGDEGENLKQLRALLASKKADVVTTPTPGIFKVSLPETPLTYNEPAWAVVGEVEYVPKAAGDRAAYALVRGDITIEQ